MCGKIKYTSLSCNFLQEKNYATSQNKDGTEKETAGNVSAVEQTQTGTVPGQNRNVTDVIQQLLELSEQVGDTQAAQLQQVKHRCKSLI